MDQINFQPDAFPKDAVKLLCDVRDAAFAAEDFLCFARSAVDFRDIEKCRLLVDPFRKIGVKDPLYDDRACRKQGPENDVFLEEEWGRSGNGKVDGVNGTVGQSAVSTFSCFNLEKASPGTVFSFSTPVASKQEQFPVEALHRHRGEASQSDSEGSSSGMHLKREGVVPAVDEMRRRFVSRCLTFLHWRTMGSVELMTETVIAAELLPAAEVGFLARVKNDELRLDEFGKPILRPVPLETSSEETHSVAPSDGVATSEEADTLSKSLSSDASGGSGEAEIKQ